MRIACISGWGQPTEALSAIAPDATHLHYAHHERAQLALSDIASQAEGHDLLIGWSLGAQLALRAVSSGLLKVRKLVLIAPPFQFMRSESLRLGMPKETFTQFKTNYAQNPFATLNRAWALIAKDDANGETVRHHLAAADKEEVVRGQWLAWLHELERFSCSSLNLNTIPPCLLIHGKNDAVVFHEQSEKFLSLLPAAKLVSLEHCGHAPHWHDSTRVRALIAEHLHG